MRTRYFCYMCGNFFYRENCELEYIECPVCEGVLRKIIDDDLNSSKRITKRYKKGGPKR